MQSAQHQVLSRAYYDSILPMSPAALEIWLRAERTWYLDCVRVKFSTADDAHNFDLETSTLSRP